jgi:hypothetical protein
MRALSLIVLSFACCSPARSMELRLVPTQRSDRIVFVAKCSEEAKAKCRAEADLGMNSAKAMKSWCIRPDGTNICKDKVLDNAATCLDACGDKKAFDRRGAIGSHPCSGNVCQ